MSVHNLCQYCTNWDAELDYCRQNMSISYRMDGDCSRLHKFRAVVSAALSFFILTSTAIPASAMSGSNEGGSGNTSWSINDTPFGVLINNDNFAWRADLYVSTNSDGKISKPSDEIGGKLALVGSLFCTSPTFANYQTYIQTNYTNESRGDFNKDGGRIVQDDKGNIGSVQYTLPTLKEFEPGAGTYEDASSHQVAIAKSGLKLFDEQWKAPTEFSKVHSRLTGDNAAVYTTKLFEQIKRFTHPEQLIFL